MKQIVVVYFRLSITSFFFESLTAELDWDKKSARAFWLETGPPGIIGKATRPLNENERCRDTDVRCLGGIYYGPGIVTDF